jgi:hypothetical protein
MSDSPRPPETTSTPVAAPADPQAPRTQPSGFVWTPPKPDCVRQCNGYRKHYLVTAQREYTGWGWFVVLFGISWRPDRIEWTCRRCNCLIDATSDPDEMERNI